MQGTADAVSLVGFSRRAYVDLMDIQLKRVYDTPESTDGYRVLVDRLWPRGLTKDKARIDEWAKDIAPSHDLRKWFHADRTRWTEFRRRYLAELKEYGERLDALAVRAGRERVTLLFSTTDTERNHAVILAERLKKN